tara:strand:- start:458 stop:826 length:369 start_codon:yes stop_codon:yes gene_type:complete
MSPKIISEKKSELMKRKELLLEIPHQKGPTPKTSDVLKEVAQTLKADEKLISIKKIEERFGSNTAQVKAFIYDNSEAKDFAEKLNKKKSASTEEAKATEAKPAEEQKAATGAETKTEEKKAK